MVDKIKKRKRLRQIDEDMYDDDIEKSNNIKNSKIHDKINQDSETASQIPECHSDEEENEEKLEIKDKSKTRVFKYHVNENSDEEDEETHEIKGKSKISAKREAQMTIGLSQRPIKYDPVSNASWKQDQKTPFLAFSILLESLEKESKRLPIIEMASDFIRSVITLSPSDLIPCMCLLMNQIAPPYEGREIGMGDMLLQKTIAETTGRARKQIQEDTEKCGDLGEVAKKSRSKQRLMFTPPPLTLHKVFTHLLKISDENRSEKKVAMLKVLLVACRGPEAKYLVRIIQGKGLRVGLASQNAIIALARAATITPPEKNPRELNTVKRIGTSKYQINLEKNTGILRMVFAEVPNLITVISNLLKVGIEDLPNHCYLTPGIPVVAMKAKPTNGVNEVLKRFANIEFTLEYKYDGERAQIHMFPNKEKKNEMIVKVFSRNAEDNTPKYPDLVKRFKDFMKPCVTSCIIDSEIVAYDVVANKILPFQTLTHRKRKDVKENEVTIRVCIFAFDLIYLNGCSLLHKPFRHRRTTLYENFIKTKTEFDFAHHLDTRDPEDMTDFLNFAVNNSCEGLVVKTLDDDATYEPDKRSFSWLKVKKDYLDGVGDTVDLVPIGGYIGKGKRIGGFGGFLLASYDPDSERYQSITKVGTGFSEKILEEHTKFLSQHQIDCARSYYQIQEKMEPDVWFEPCQVWEVKAADLSLSPVHCSAMGEIDPDKGIALRFPRFLRIRPDKKPEDATNSQQIVELYQNQFKHNE